MDTPVPPGEGIDTTTPNVARVYDYWLGGRQNFAADRELAQRLEQLYPPVPILARRNREWVCRAVTWAAGEGVTQFLDLGSGLPARPAVHETARASAGEARHVRVAYVDNDPVAVSHSRNLLAGPGLAAVRADLADPAAVMTNKDVLSVIDPAEPVCVVAAMVLHFFDSDTARAITAGYAGLLAPGSMLAISVPRNDDEGLFAQIRETFAGAAELYNHSRADILSFFAGLPMAAPGLVVSRAWRGGMPDPGLAPGVDAYVLAGLAMVP